MSERYFKGGTRDLINNRIRSIKDSTCLDLTERKLNLHAIPWNLRTHEGRVYSMSRKCQTCCQQMPISGPKACYSANVNGVVALSCEHLDDGTYFKCKAP